MKVAQTYVFVFVPIPAEWIAHQATVRGLSGGPSGSSPTDRKYNEKLRW